MSGRVALTAPTETGLPWLAISNFEPTKRETKICSMNLPSLNVFSCHVTQGTVGLDGFIVPAATRGSTASFSGFALSEHSPSTISDPAHLPKLLNPLLSSTPLVELPTTSQWNPPVADGSFTPLA